MAIIRHKSKRNVYEAARMRVRNVFSNGLPVYLSFSGGKDSIALAGVIYDAIQEGDIDPSLLTVNFIDEEGIFDCVEKIVLEWRKKFMMAGAKFNWWCIEAVHYNSLNQLEKDESFICWDSEKKDVWIRPMPKFAITDHPLLRKRVDTYQDFLDKHDKGGITLIGTRAAESLQRLTNISKKKTNRRIYPIYDWKDSDVWKYIKDNNLNIPEVYEHLWRSGRPRRLLRVSQFFSSDTIGILVKLQEFYPDLMERILRREPNAYMVSIYWDTEMFRRSTAKRRKMEEGETPRDYEKEVHELLSNIPRNFPKPNQMQNAREYKKLILQTAGKITDKHYKQIYHALIGGDPKRRTLRAIQASIYVEWRKRNGQ